MRVVKFVMVLFVISIVGCAHSGSSSAKEEGSRLDDAAIEKYRNDGPQRIRSTESKTIGTTVALPKGEDDGSGEDASDGQGVGDADSPAAGGDQGGDFSSPAGFNPDDYEGNLGGEADIEAGMSEGAMDYEAGSVEAIAPE